MPFPKLERIFFWFLKEDNRNKVKENMNGKLEIHDGNGYKPKEKTNGTISTISNIDTKKRIDPTFI